MKSKLDIRSLLCGALLGAVIVFAVAAAKTNRSSWEYTAYYYNQSHPDLTAINKLGNDGWDLVGSFSGHDAKAPGFIFKRER